jgi:hypothetical protein
MISETVIVGSWIGPERAGVGMATAGASEVGENGAGVCPVCAKALALRDDIRIGRRRQ